MRARVLGALLCVCLSLGALLCALFYVGTSEDIMFSLFCSHVRPAVTGVEGHEAYLTLSERLCGYLKGDIDSSQCVVTRFEKPQNAFSEKELSHLSDVRALFALCKWVYRALLAAALACALALVLTKAPPYDAAKGYLRALIVLLALCAALILWAAVDFDGLFTLMHRVLFTNNLWLLDARTDLLVQLMPLPFFIDSSKQILLRALPALLPLPFAALARVRHAKRKAEPV